MRGDTGGVIGDTCTVRGDIVGVRGDTGSVRGDNDNTYLGCVCHCSGLSHCVCLKDVNELTQ